MRSMTPSLALVLVLALLAPVSGAAAEFGHKGGPDIANIEEVAATLRQDPYDMELLISFGTSKGGSGGHLALALRDQAENGNDDLVYSANFYADRAPEHAQGFYTENLMAIIPKKEYLFKTTSSLGPDGSFGLDMGEIYKRSVIGIRVYGVPAQEREKLTAFFHRLNDDFHADLPETEYHKDRIIYGYMNLNCAKTVGVAFKYGAGYEDLPIKGTSFWAHLNFISALTANIPTEMAMNLVKEFGRRGYGMDVVLYKKYAASTYTDPHEEAAPFFKDLPNRFPSVLSLDYREDQGQYEDYDNLYAMYLLYNMGKYSIILDPATKLLTVEAAKAPLPYEEASAKANTSAKHDKKNLLRRVLFRAWGVKLGGATDNTGLYDYDAGAQGRGDAPGAVKIEP